MKVEIGNTVRCADCGKIIGQISAHTINLSKHDKATFKLCIASAWLHGSISGARARELAPILGMTAKEIEDLKFIEAEHQERERESKRAPAATTRQRPDAGHEKAAEDRSPTASDFTDECVGLAERQRQGT